MMNDILFAIWFLLPAALANSAPVFSSRIPGLKKLDAPIDGGRAYRGKAVLGKNKTWRGLISGVVVATVVLALEQWAAANFDWTTAWTGGVDYSLLPTWLLGPAFGLGALGGDALESFFKRQRGIESGGSWMPFDQLDYIAGAVLLSLPIVVAAFSQYVWMFIVWFLVHIGSTIVGWKLGLKDRPL
jgi:CDP-2,3-bis-(O-geranylgeranyl)-sn-glycerol synthase